MIEGHLTECAAVAASVAAAAVEARTRLRRRSAGTSKKAETGE